MTLRICAIILAALLTGCNAYRGPQLAEPPLRLTSLQYALPTHGDRRFAGERQPAPALMDNACTLLHARPHWRNALRGVRQRWRVEPWVILAFLHQESHFNPTAMSTSRAYGYAQIKDDSWDWYALKTGNRTGKRDRFDDAVDFIGFYVTKNVERNRVPLNDTKRQYLAYHEGLGGYERRSYLEKPWLLAVSDKVADRARRYKTQLAQCPIR